MWHNMENFEALLKSIKNLKSIIGSVLVVLTYSIVIQNYL